MGLEIADLVMDVEDHFGVEIDESKNPIETVGALHAVIVEMLQQQGPVDSQAILEKLRNIVSKHTKYPVKAESRFIEDLDMN